MSATRLDADALPPEVVAACRGACSKLALDPVVLDVGEVLAIAEHFVVTSAANERQVRAIAEEVERVVADELGTKPARVEGLDTLRWVLLDYGELVVHVFLDEERGYYELERLWGDVPSLRWDEVEQAQRGDAASG